MASAAPLSASPELPVACEACAHETTEATLGTKGCLPQFSGPPRKRKKSLIEDHFDVDAEFRLKGPLVQDPNKLRDMHDWFNLVVLLPVCVFNVLNWGCPKEGCAVGVDGGWPDARAFWHGEWFFVFWTVTFAYFLMDLGWMFFFPKCVKSPSLIIKHHVLTLLYIFVPFVTPELEFLMGACMIVEINTWFLIARRVFNRSGAKPFTKGVSLLASLKMVTISVCFYVTWFAIRMGLYPAILVALMGEWHARSMAIGTWFNWFFICPVIQSAFCMLNAKWTVDLVRSKLRSQGAGRGL